MHRATIAPPADVINLCQVQGEEDEKCCDDQATVQGCRSDVVVLQPPSCVTTLDEVIENNTDDSPAEVNVDSRRRQEARTSVNHRCIDVAPE